MNVGDFVFPLEKNGTIPISDDDKLEYVRRVAMRTPEVVCKLLIRAGLVDVREDVQVVVVEGICPILLVDSLIFQSLIP